MPIKHLSYSSNGRTFRVLKGVNPTGQLCFKSQIGQENIDIGHGAFAPYVKNESARTLTFKRSRIHLTDTGIEFYIWDKKAEDYILRTTASFHPEIKESEVWNRKTSTATAIVWEDITNEDFTDFGKVSYVVSTGDMDVKVSIEVGGSSRALFSFEIKSKVSAEQRLVWHTDEMEAAIPIEAVYDVSKGIATRIIGYSFRGYAIRWNYAEAVERKGEGITTGEETKIIIAEKAYTQGQIATIKPDQWGETGVANTNDDCSENGGVDLDGYDQDGCLCGTDWGSVGQDYSCRFQDVTIAANPVSVDAGTQIEYDCGYREGTGFTFRVFGLEGNTPAFNITAPSTRTRTTAYADFAAPGSKVADNLVNGSDFRAVVKEILDTSWSSGYNLGFTFDGNDPSFNNYIQIEDYSTTGDWGEAAARLTIVYTPAAGAFFFKNIQNTLLRM